MGNNEHSDNVVLLLLGRRCAKIGTDQVPTSTPTNPAKPRGKIPPSRNTLRSTTTLLAICIKAHSIAAAIQQDLGCNHESFPSPHDTRKFSHEHTAVASKH
mmetsp:Transcript_6158/g.8062  ORF Transcript_6158/g.8062 Transcript_6158/m.8062 type:complete len:101 (-) Transcript_6158:426-728(-)